MSYKHKNTSAPNPVKTNITSPTELFLLELFVAVISLMFAYYSYTVGAITASISCLILGLACVCIVLWTIKNFISDALKRKKEK